MFLKQRQIPNIKHGRDQNRSEGFALTGYDIPGCVDDGAWMLWENSSAVAVAAVAHPGLGGGAPRLWLFPKSNHKNAPPGALL